MHVTLKGIVARGRTHAKATTFLKREVRLTDNGWEYEGNRAHVHDLLTTLGMIDCKPGARPGGAEAQDDDERALTTEEHKMFRRAGGILQYMAIDRVDLAFATKEVARRASAPTASSLRALKKIARHVKWRPRMTIDYGFGAGFPSTVKVWSDSDHA